MGINQRLIRECSDKNWKRGIKKLSRKVHETGLLDLLTGSGRLRTLHSCVNISAVEELAQSQESKPHMH